MKCNLKHRFMQKDKDPNLVLIWKTCGASWFKKVKADRLQTASNKNRLKCVSLFHFFTFLFINTYKYIICWRHRKLTALYFKPYWAHTRGMSPGKHRCRNIKAGVCRSPRVPWAQQSLESLHTIKAEPRQGDQALIQHHLNHWEKLRIFWEYPWYANKERLWSTTDSTVSWALTHRQFSFQFQLFFSDLLTFQRRCNFYRSESLNVAVSHAVCFITFTSTALPWAPTCLCTTYCSSVDIPGYLPIWSSDSCHLEKVGFLLFFP